MLAGDARRQGLRQEWPLRDRTGNVGATLYPPTQPHDYGWQGFSCIPGQCSSVACMQKRVKAMVGVAVLGLGIIGALTYFPHDAFRRTEVLSSYATITLPDAGYTVRAEVARTPEAQIRGLSGRDALAPGTGMLFVFDMLDQHHIWMKDMRFSIDIIWIAGGVVVDTHENLPVPLPDADPATLPYFNPRPQALFAVEVPAGDVAAHHIVPGQRIKILFDR